MFNLCRLRIFVVLQTVQQKCDLVFTSTVSIRSTNKRW